jgi:flavorubredoxin
VNAATDLPRQPATDGPTSLYQADAHAVFWLGVEEQTAFRCNTYLILDGDQAYLLDPGSRAYFPQVRERVASLLPPEKLTALLIGHQDPDVGASMVDWLDLNPEIEVVSSPRTRVLLPHYGRAEFRFHDIEAQPELALPSGARLQFITAPFLHSPMAFTTYDSASGFLFTGDIFAAVQSDWHLVVEDFASHRAHMDLFHIDYMASNAAARGFVRKLDGLTINALLPQHGSIIPAALVPDALDYLRELRCGLDVLYPDLD